ncbi:MAG: hypothetical protein [Sanya fiers-like virus 17]|nr:MAG: hypothetical protein [Sanya fiers-like virus 17]
MPQMADITVKKDNGTTDIVFSAQSPSSGDGTAAVWKSTTVGTAASHQPELRLSAREGAKGARRALRATFVYPEIATNSTTGVTSVVQKALFATDVTLPKDMAATNIAEAVSQYCNLLASALIKSCLKSGYSAS